MSAPRKFSWGQRVVADADLFNDGTFPEREADALLIRKGTAGEVVQVGRHTESDIAVYMVEFAGGDVVGCLEQEIVSA